QRSEPGPTWPEYTNLGRSPPGNTITLKFQAYEVKLVIRKAINLIEGRVRFRDAFPPLPKRSQWCRDCFEKACEGFANSSPSGAKEKYMMIRERLDSDHEYFKEASSLPVMWHDQDGCSQQCIKCLQPPCWVFRNSARTTEEKAIYLPPGTKHMDFHSSLLPVLMMRKGRDYLREKPFEHDAIIGTLWDTLFTNKTRTIVQQFPGCFKPNQERTYALSPAMVALAATAVFAALKEWELGFRNAIQFTTNLYHGVYLDHIKGLNEIKEEKPLAYTSLMRRLFHMVSYVMVYSGC
ncbi:hypothetical protein AX14_010269, partial [Amanita brunnescens Koide BX004]